MATETGGAVSPHIRGVTVTTVACVFGVAAGVASAVLSGGPGDTLGLAILGGAVLVQFPLLGLVGIDVSDFSTKDRIYVAFMTFAMWFITWALLLTTGTFG